MMSDQLEEHKKCTIFAEDKETQTNQQEREHERASNFPQPLFKLIDPALVFSVNVVWGDVPTSPLAVAPTVLRFTDTGKLILIEPALVLALRWKLGFPVSVISIDPALVSKSYVPVEPIEPLKLMLPAFVLNVELPDSEDCVAPTLPALLINDIIPLTPFTLILPAFVCICRSVVFGTVIVKSTLVALKKLNVPELLVATVNVLPLWL